MAFQVGLHSSDYIIIHTCHVAHDDDVQFICCSGICSQNINEAFLVFSLSAIVFVHSLWGGGVMFYTKNPGVCLLDLTFFQFPAIIIS